MSVRPWWLTYAGSYPLALAPAITDQLQLTFQYANPPRPGAEVTFDIEDDRPVKVLRVPATPTAPEP